MSIEASMMMDPEFLPGEQIEVVVRGVDCCFHRIAAAYGKVTVTQNMRLKSSQTTNRGEHGEASFYSILLVVISVV